MMKYKCNKVPGPYCPENCQRVCHDLCAADAWTISPRAWKPQRPVYSSCGIFKTDGTFSITYGEPPHLRGIRDFDKSHLRSVSNAYHTR